jgi:hypothetical protein
LHGAALTLPHCFRGEFQAARDIPRFPPLNAHQQNIPVTGFQVWKRKVNALLQGIAFLLGAREGGGDSVRQFRPQSSFPGAPGSLGTDVAIRQVARHAMNKLRQFFGFLQCAFPKRVQCGDQHIVGYVAWRLSVACATDQCREDSGVKPPDQLVFGGPISCRDALHERALLSRTEKSLLHAFLQL